jgi:hypothetical protein
MNVAAIGGALARHAASYVPPAPPPDPKVTDAVVETIQAGTAFGPEPVGAVAYQIQQQLADSSLTQAQKDDFVAQLVDLTHSPGWSTLDNGSTVPEIVQAALEQVGAGDGSEESAALGNQVADAIGRGVSTGRLDVDDLYGLVDPSTNAFSDGGRQLLTQVTDGRMLNQVAGRLLDAARAEGYDINAYENGPALLVAAGDIANMAAANGVRASANAVVREIGRIEAAGPVAGDMGLMEAMMATTSTGAYSSLVAPDRNGFDVLAGLVNAANPAGSDIQTTTDSMFATLVRSGYTGSENGSGLGELGAYFNSNLGRLNENGWRFNSAEDARENLVQDFVGKIMLDADYPVKDESVAAIGNEMDRLAGQLQNGELTPDQRLAGATGLGELVGSVKGGADDFFKDSKESKDAKIDAIRFFSDKLTGFVSGKAGPAGALIDAGIDAAWTAGSEHLDAGIRKEVREALGSFYDQSNQLRTALGGMDAGLINAFDQRYVEHVPDA